MHCARAADSRVLGRRVVRVEAAALLAARFPAVTAWLEFERLLEQLTAALGIRRERAHAVEALQRQLGRDLWMLRGQRLVARLDHRELVAHALGVDERQPVVLPREDVVVEALLPEVHCVAGRDPPPDGMHHPGAGAALARARVLEEGDVGPRVATLVRVEEVVHGRVILVDGLLDEAEAEQADVELDVSRRVGRDRSHVVDAFELHACFNLALRACIPLQGYSPPSPAASRRRHCSAAA